MSDEGANMRSRRKGDSLFTMIPLERWNVERRSTSQHQERRMIGASRSSRPPKTPWNRRQNRDVPVLRSMERKYIPARRGAHAGTDQSTTVGGEGVQLRSEGVHPPQWCPAEVRASGTLVERVFRELFPATD